MTDHKDRNTSRVAGRARGTARAREGAHSDERWARL